MTPERRRSNLHDLINKTPNDPAAEGAHTLESHLSPTESRENVITKPSRPVLPPINTPDKCRSLLGCMDAHPKETHNGQHMGMPREFAPNFGMTGQQQIEASQYPSPLSGVARDLNMTGFGTSNSGLSSIGVDPLSCNSSNPSGSMSMFFHTCMTGPNALDSSASASHRSIGRHSSDPKDWCLTASQRGSSDRPIQQHDWIPNSDRAGTHPNPTPSGENMEHLTASQHNSSASPIQLHDSMPNSDPAGTHPNPPLSKEEMAIRDDRRARVLVARSLAKMNRVCGDPPTHSAKDGGESSPPTNLYDRVRRQADIYKDAALLPVEPAMKHRFGRELCHRQKDSQTAQPTFTNPFARQSEPAACNLEMAYPNRKLPPLNSSSVDGLQGSSSAVLGKRHRVDEEPTRQEFHGYGRLTGAREVPDGGPFSNPPGYAPIQADNGPRYGPIQENSDSPQSDSVSPSKKRRSRKTNDDATERSDDAQASSAGQASNGNDTPQSADTEHEVDEENGQDDEGHSHPISLTNPSRTFVCSFMPHCDTSENNERKAVSDYFGRNKSCTLQIPRSAWILYCRQHYQRVKYRFHQESIYYQFKGLGVLDQIEKFDMCLGAARFPEHGPIVWTIVYQKGLQSNVNQALKRVASGQQAIIRTDDKDLKPKMAELAIALNMEEFCGTNKTSEDVKLFVRRLLPQCRDSGLDTLPRVEFLPVRWGGKDRTKGVPRR